eukprot:3644514-Rhodomonas_salina.1
MCTFSPPVPIVYVTGSAGQQSSMQATASVAGEALTSFLSHDVSLSPACRGATEGCDSAVFGFSYTVFMCLRLPSVSIFGRFYLRPPTPAVWVAELWYEGLSSCSNSSDSGSEGYVRLDAITCVPVVVDAFPDYF